MDSLTRFVAFMTLICIVAALGAARHPLVASSGPEGANGLIRATYVAITNNLGSGLQVTVHCKSGDDDLGDHSLEDGQKYEFKFRPNFWETTLFFCSFSRIGGSVAGVVYQARRDVERCGNLCSWTITMDGVNGMNSDGVGEIVYKWN